MENKFKQSAKFLIINVEKILKICCHAGSPCGVVTAKSSVSAPDVPEGLAAALPVIVPKVTPLKPGCAGGY